MMKAALTLSDKQHDFHVKSNDKGTFLWHQCVCNPTRKQHHDMCLRLFGAFALSIVWMQWSTATEIVTKTISLMFVMMLDYIIIIQSACVQKVSLPQYNFNFGQYRGYLFWRNTTSRYILMFQIKREVLLWKCRIQSLVLKPDFVENLGRTSGQQ